MAQPSFDRPIVWRCGERVPPHQAHQGRRGSGPRVGAAVVLVAALFGLAGSHPAAAQACDPCPAYATADLNLRKGPDPADVVLRVIPAGAEVQRALNGRTNGYDFVTSGGDWGWAAADFLAWTEPAASADERTALTALNLRAGPSPDADAILVVPEGGVVTLTGDGDEGGYVTVDYGGTAGWVYADLLG